MAKETCVRKCRLGSFTICLRCGEGHALILCPPTLPAQQCPENTFNNNRRWKLLMRNKKNYAIKMAGRQRGGMELGSSILRLLYSWFTICASFVFPQFPRPGVCGVFPPLASFSCFFSCFSFGFPINCAAFVSSSAAEWNASIKPAALADS